MKKIEWLNRNRMKIETGCKTFDRQCTCITTGNQIGNCVISSYIRPSTELECNGFISPKGHLQNFDFSGFKDLPNEVEKWIREYDKKCILYKFRHFSNGHSIVDGWIITDPNHNFLKMFYGNSRKAVSIMNVVKEYVCN